LYKNYENRIGTIYFNATWGCLSSASAKVLLTVTQVNDSPVLAPIGNKIVVKGTILSFTAKATDVNSTQAKTFSLITPPSSATSGATTGVFSRKPTATGSFTFKVWVTDNGAPTLYDEETLTVTVTSSALTSIKKNNEVFTDTEKSFTLFATPNPAARYFTLMARSITNKVLNLQVFNDLGQVVEEIRSVSSNGTIQIGHNYKPGTYLVKARQGEHTVFVKLLKQ
jgi:hypothetical protein